MAKEKYTGNNPIGYCPKWAQILLFAVLLGGAFATKLTYFSDSAESKHVKEQMSPIAEKLAAAYKIGDPQGGIALLDSATSVMKELGSPPYSTKAELRPCVVAGAHLVDGVINLTNGMAWSNKAQYQAAFDSCK